VWREGVGQLLQIEHQELENPPFEQEKKSSGKKINSQLKRYRKIQRPGKSPQERCFRENERERERRRSASRRKSAKPWKKKK